MAQFKIIHFQEVNNKIQYVFENCHAEQIANAVGGFMHQQGYRLEEGNPMNGVYGIGNKVMRILFGAFVKRFAFQVYITQNGPNAQMEFGKGMSGFSGGVIGIAKLNTEFKRLAALFHQL